MAQQQWLYQIIKTIIDGNGVKHCEAYSRYKKFWDQVNCYPDGVADALV